MGWLYRATGLAPQTRVLTLNPATAIEKPRDTPLPTLIEQTRPPLGD